jgi:hypothetical protein
MSPFLTLASASSATSLAPLSLPNARARIQGQLGVRARRARLVQSRDRQSKTGSSVHCVRLHEIRMSWPQRQHASVIHSLAATSSGFLQLRVLKSGRLGCTSQLLPIFWHPQHHSRPCAPAWSRTLPRCRICSDARIARRGSTPLQPAALAAVTLRSPWKTTAPLQALARRTPLPGRTGKSARQSTPFPARRACHASSPRISAWRPTKGISP